MPYTKSVKIRCELILAVHKQRLFMPNPNNEFVGTFKQSILRTYQNSR